MVVHTQLKVLQASHILINLRSVNEDPPTIEDIDPTTVNFGQTDSIRIVVTIDNAELGLNANGVFLSVLLLSTPSNLFIARFWNAC